MEIFYTILRELNIPINSFTTIASLLIVLFVLTIFIFLVGLPYKKLRSERLESFQNKIRDQIEEILYAWTSNEKTFDEVVSSLQSILKNKRTIMLMLKTFNHFSESFKGQMLKELIDIFYATKLKDYAISQLKSGNSYDKALALRVLGNMHVIEYENIILHQSFKNNPVLRSESLVALIELKESDMAASLSDFKNQVSDWDQLLILETMKALGPPETKTLLAWLNSDNNDIIVLGIRVVYLFNLFELLDTVVKLLDHSSPKVRWAVLYTLDVQGADGYENILIKFLDKANTDEMVLILNILSSHTESVEKRKLMPLLRTGNPLVEYAALNLLHLKKAVPEKKELNDEQLDMIAAITN